MKAIMKTLLSLIPIIYPMEQNHTSNMSCMNCAMKKEDDVEFINYDNDYDLDGHD